MKPDDDQPASPAGGVLVPAHVLEAMRKARRAKNKFSGSILEALGSADEAPPVLRSDQCAS